MPSGRDTYISPLKLSDEYLWQGRNCFSLFKMFQNQNKSKFHQQKYKSANKKMRLKTIMENNRLDDFIDEQRSLQRAIVVDNRLTKLVPQGKFPIILFSFIITLLLICGFGFSISKNGKMSIIMPEPQIHNSVDCPQSFVVNQSCLLVTLHHRCNVKLCKTNGEISCVDEYVLLTEAEVRAFFIDSCVNYGANKNCHLVKNSTAHVFKPKHCECICKSLLTF